MDRREDIRTLEALEDLVVELNTFLVYVTVFVAKQ